MIDSELIFIYETYAKHLSKRVFIWEPVQDNKWDGTIDEIRQIQPFLHKFVVTFIWNRDVFHPVQARQDLACLSRHSHNNIFHIYSSNRDEKRPALLNFYLIDLLVCLIFLRSSQPELLEKDSRKVCGHIKIPVHEFIAENEEIYWKWSFLVCFFWEHC